MKHPRRQEDAQLVGAVGQGLHQQEGYLREASPLGLTTRARQEAGRPRLPALCLWCSAPKEIAVIIGQRKSLAKDQVLHIAVTQEIVGEAQIHGAEGIQFGDLFVAQLEFQGA